MDGGIVSSDYWARVRAPIGAGDGTVPPYNFRDGKAKKCDAWRWQDWDGDALVINEYGSVRCETDCFVQLSAAQWAEIAVVAAHVAPIVAAMEERASAEVPT